MPEQEQQECTELILLLDEYMTARESDPEVALAPYEERAGERAQELRRYVAIAGELDGLSQFQGHDELPLEGNQEFGRFQIRGVLGSGGNSRVFLAHDPQLGRMIALKVLTKAEHGTTHDALPEARALARFDHPSVVKVFEVGEHLGQAYIAMERIQGEDLRSIVRALQSNADSGRQRSDDPSDPGSDTAASLRTTAERCRMVARIARALAYCHQDGVVHRDVKPENILIDGELTPKLVDFGLARHEETAQLNVTQGLRGTPAYFAPEQVDRGTGGASPASDQFALGTILYELLTLVHPFRAGTLNATMTAISAAAPPPLRRHRPELPLDVELICLKCLERDPARRYATMSSLADDLEAFLEHRAVSVRAPSPVRQIALGLARYRKSLLIVLAAFLATTLGISAIWVANVERERHSLVTQLGAELAALDLMMEPDQFGSQFQSIIDRRSQAARLDRSFFGRLRGYRTSARLAGLWGAACERLQEAMVSPPRAIEPTKNTARHAKYAAKWDGLEYLAGVSAPPMETARSPFKRQNIDLPSGGRLQRYSPSALPAAPVLVDVQDWAGALESGIYRYSLRRGGASCETEFTVRTFEPRWSPECIALNPSVRLGMVRVPANRSLDPMSQELYQCEPFLISSSVVTWNQLKKVLKPTELRQLQTVEGDSLPSTDEPAVVPWAFAAAYATSVGARIPTPQELSAWAQSAPQEFPPLLRMEWVSAFFANDNSVRFARLYDPESPGHWGVGARSLRERNIEATNVGTGFRLAWSCPQE